MELPQFRLVDDERGTGVTYECGCPCQPTAYPDEENPGFEHCCCGKVHFAGPGAADAFTGYLADRAARRKREPRYQRGRDSIEAAGVAIEVAWAFPAD